MVKKIIFDRHFHRSVYGEKATILNKCKRKYKKHLCQKLFRFRIRLFLTRYLKKRKTEMAKYKHKLALIKRLNFMQHRDFEVFSKKFGYITLKQLEAIDKAIRRKAKKRSRLSMHIHATNISTKKPSGVRMGKGKGVKINKQYALVRPGQLLLSIPKGDIKYHARIKDALQGVLNKLPLPNIMVEELINIRKRRRKPRRINAKLNRLIKRTKPFKTQTMLLFKKILTKKSIKLLNTLTEFSKNILKSSRTITFIDIMNMNIDNLEDFDDIEAEENLNSFLLSFK